MSAKNRKGQKSSGENGFKNGKTNGSSAHANGNGTIHDKDPLVQEKGPLYSLIHHTLVPLFLIASCPNLVIVLWYTAVKCNGSFLAMGTKLASYGVVGGFQELWSHVTIGSPAVVGVLLGYCAFAIFLQVAMPGPRAEGPLTPKGNTPVYKDNGFTCFIVTMVTFSVLHYYLRQNGLSTTYVYDHFQDFLGTVTVFSLILCVGLYLKGLFAPSTTDSGSSGNPIFDYYWGTELYPRIFGVDVKVFTNCRFGMTVWPLLVAICALKSYEIHGFVDSIWVSAALHMAYFTKFFWWEAGYMRTIDIMVDRAGFYICWGCLTYVPGLYACTSFYLVNNPVQLGPLLSLAILAAGLGGIAVNYIADHQKQLVRNTNGKCKIWGKTPEMIRAKYYLENGEERESILLVSGWWGVARHFHYVPELFLSFCWCLPGLFNHVMAYTYFLWLVILLTHRTFRDDEKCAKKYGKYWKTYRERVPYKMIPGIF